MSATQTPSPQTAPLAEPETKVAPSRWQTALQAIVTGNGIISLLAVLLAVIVGSIMIAATNEEVQAASGYFFAQPGYTFAAIWEAVSQRFPELLRGSQA